MPSQDPPVENTTVFASLRSDSFDQGVVIPEFQRRFEWDEEHYNRLWEDACACADRGRSNRHYLGPVVLTRARDQFGRAELVDGQQRFTVLSLIAIAIRDVLRRMSDHQSTYREDALNECLSFLRFHQGGEYRRILSFSHSLDDEAYKLLFARPADAGIETPTRRESKLKKAHWHFFSKLSAEQTSVSAQEFSKRCNDIAYACFHQLDCSPIYVRDAEVAFFVFEHINHQGKKLTQADLLKNLLLRLTPSSRQQCAANWLRFIENANEVKNVDPVTLAWYCWAAESDEATIKSTFYRELRENVRSEDRAMSFSVSLVDSSEQVKAWAMRSLVSRPRFLSDRSIKICPYALLQQFGYKTPYPVLLKCKSLRSRHGDSDRVCEHLADLLVRMLVRNKSICRIKCEEAIAETAVRCLVETSNESNSERVVSELARRLSQLDADDDTVRQELQAMRLEGSALPKGLLYLEFQASSPGVSLQEGSVIDLEHVLPKSILTQSPSGIREHSWRAFQVTCNQSVKSVKDWLAQDPDIVQPALEELVHSIGNLALLTYQVNRSIKDSGFPEKRPYLSGFDPQQNERGSKVPTTAEIGDRYSEWTEQIIHERASSLARRIMAGIPGVRARY